MKKIGKVTKAWLKRREKWIKEHPPNHQDAWICGICGAWVYRWDMELDHIVPRGAKAKAQADSDENLQPTHRYCNQRKGSKRLPDKRHVPRPEVW
jgi:5-methylcytosine-specific restriction endonuclease McrA